MPNEVETQLASQASRIAQSCIHARTHEKSPKLRRRLRDWVSSKPLSRSCSENIERLKATSVMIQLDKDFPLGGVKVVVKKKNEVWRRDSCWGGGFWGLWKIKQTRGAKRRGSTNVLSDWWISQFHFWLILMTCVKLMKPKLTKFTCWDRENGPEENSTDEKLPQGNTDNYWDFLSDEKQLDIRGGGSWSWMWIDSQT